MPKANWRAKLIEGADQGAVKRGTVAEITRLAPALPETFHVCEKIASSSLLKPAELEVLVTGNSVLANTCLLHTPPLDAPN